MSTDNTTLGAVDGIDISDVLGRIVDGSSQIMFTRDYNRFDISEHNRPIKHKANLDKSFRAFGFKKKNAIDCYEEDGRLVVVDGHHRFFYAKKYDTGVFYKLIEKKSADPISDALSSTRHSLSDIAHYWDSRGKEDYGDLLSYHEEYRVPLGLAATLLMDSTNNSEAGRAIKAGTFKVTNQARSIAVGHIFKKLLEAGLAITNKTAFLPALNAVLKIDIVDKNVLLRRLMINVKRIKYCLKAADYLREIEDSYNYHLNPDSEIAIVTKARRMLTRKRKRKTDNV